MNVDQANRQALERLMAARPFLVGVARAGEVVPGLTGRTVFHAGPPIEWERMAGPMQGGVIGACLYEGWAKNEAEARELIESGGVALDSCHHHGATGPMAGILSPAMAVYVVEDREHGGRFFSQLNEGYGKVLRYGAFAPEVLERLRWLNEDMAPLVDRALRSGGGIDLRTLIAEALQMGDEGHNRNKAGSLIFLRLLAPHLVGTGPAASQVLEFLGQNPLSVLNPVMAACKAMADAAHDVPGSTIVSTMARNGTDFGIRVSGLGGQWFTAAAEVPVGLFFPGFTAADANPDLGDSAITETAGIGAFAMAAAPAIVSFVGGSADDARRATLEMYEISAAEHQHFKIPSLGFRGTPTGIDLRKVVELGITPRINTGIAHRLAGVGQVGAGLVRPPMAIFEAALLAFAEKYLSE
jgi:hypothetical protein